jgi:hypothetical protein
MSPAVPAGRLRRPPWPSNQKAAPVRRASLSGADDRGSAIQTTSATASTMSSPMTAASSAALTPDSTLEGRGWGRGGAARGGRGGADRRVGWLSASRLGIAGQAVTRTRPYPDETPRPSPAPGHHRDCSGSAPGPGQLAPCQGRRLTTNMSAPAPSTTKSLRWGRSSPAPGTTPGAARPDKGRPGTGRPRGTRPGGVRHIHWTPGWSRKPGRPTGRSRQQAARGR